MKIFDITTYSETELNDLADELDHESKAEAQFYADEMALTTDVLVFSSSPAAKEFTVVAKQEARSFIQSMATVQLEWLDHPLAPVIVSLFKSARVQIATCRLPSLGHLPDGALAEDPTLAQLVAALLREGFRVEKFQVTDDGA